MRVPIEDRDVARHEKAGCATAEDQSPGRDDGAAVNRLGLCLFLSPAGSKNEKLKPEVCEAQYVGPMKHRIRLPQSSGALIVHSG